MRMATLNRRPISRKPEAALQPVSTLPRQLSAYEGIASESMLAEIRRLASAFKGLKVVHINATPDGGGVAEILASLVPLSRDLGLHAQWFTLPPDGPFFAATKQIHNWLQGQPGDFTVAHRRTYRNYLESLARRMRGMEADIWVIHDPQPLPLRSMVPLKGRAIWRCHIDCSTPNMSVQNRLLPWVRAYDQTLFSMRAYTLPGLVPDRVGIQQPCIDPLTPKNRRVPRQQAERIIAQLGIDPKRPLVTQISRFDRWKNPWQAVDAYRLAKRSVPHLQLALVGVFSAKDDPEAPQVYRAVRDYVGADADVHLFTDPDLIGAMEVNALQSESEVILQRSTREGFGLTVTEAMWKGRPVIATPVGGIPGQIDHARTGFLVESAAECAEHIVELLGNPRLARQIGAAAHRSVRARFLLPRLMLDELREYGDLLRGRAGRTNAKQSSAVA